MTDTVPALRAEIRSSAALARRFEAVVFDWDGTAVLNRHADVRRLRELVEAGSAHGLELAIVSEADVGDVDGELQARPAGPGGLILALNHGSEVFSVDQHGPHLELRRTASPEEDATLSRAARLTVERLAARGLETRIVGEANRREIDLMPEFEWEGVAKAGIAGLLAAVERRLAAAGIGGLCEAVALAREAAAEVGLADLRVTSDVKHVAIGLTEKWDSGRWIMHWLWRRGIAPGQVLIAGGELGPLEDLLGGDWLLFGDHRGHGAALSAGVEPDGVLDGVVLVGVGPEALLAVLEDQIARRRGGELPIVVEDPRWALVIEDGDPLLARVHESLLTLADGRLGTRGSTLSRQAGREPSVMMSGVYARRGSETHLLAAPRWNEVFAGESAGRVRRVLDLHAGVLHQRIGDGSGLCEALLFSSLKRPGTPALRARAPIQSLRVARSLQLPPAVRCVEGEDDGLVWVRGSVQPASIAAAAHGRLRASDSEAVLDRVAAYEGAPQGIADHDRALERVRRARADGFDALLAEHRREWASRWEDADVAIEGDCELQLAVRFAFFHLIASVADEGEAAVGARGLSGRAYRGHVFWDSDVYVLPFLAATHPRAARAMLEYRIRRLPAALRAARAEGRQGARFPWESARSGRDVTPSRVRGHRGESIAVLTGELEEHIVADVAWAAACYIDWTGDQAFASGPGRELLVQTARWWASRIDLDKHGRAHIRGVIGPDEYHERVDDNAYTNVMARWNLRRAAQASDQAADQSERSRWLQLAEVIVDGYDPATGIYEQFGGFHQLEPLLIAKQAPQRPVAADMLLGHERTRSAQVVKQADVLMLHYLVPDEVATGSLEPNLDFYDPRTAHASTLSPGVHAALLARAGRIEQAIQALRLTARIDLDDIGHMTAGGLHIAAMGNVWRALTYGFAGLRAVGDELAIDPILPPGWQTLDVRVRFRGSRVRCRIRTGEVELTADPPLSALSPAGEQVRLTASPQLFELKPPSERKSR